MSGFSFQPVDLRQYLWRIAAFEIVILILLLLLAPRLIPIIRHNPVLNLIIIAVLFTGMGYALLLARRVVAVSLWLRDQRAQDGTFQEAPRLLAATANLLRQKPTPALDRAVLDSLAGLLDEQRESLRYMMGLLIFLGLLGTFWGLLQTVGTVSEAMQAVSGGDGSPAEAFERMRTGLMGPMQGMRMAFSASLLGLSGSLILGFLNLQVGQAQNRFISDFEEWLSLREHDRAFPVAEQDLLASLEETLAKLEMLERGIATQAVRLADAPKAETLAPFAMELTTLAGAIRDVQMRTMEEVMERLKLIEALVAASLRHRPDELLSQALRRAADFTAAPVAEGGLSHGQA